MKPAAFLAAIAALTLAGCGEEHQDLRRSAEEQQKEGRTRKGEHGRQEECASATIACSAIDGGDAATLDDAESLHIAEAQRDAEHDAQRHPDAEVALEDAHGRGVGLRHGVDPIQLRAMASSAAASAGLLRVSRGRASSCSIL